MALTIDGFEDVQEIGRGGFGVVYRARQPTFRRVVAIKVMAEAVDDRSRARFEREAAAMGAVSGHPNIVVVHEAGSTADGRPYLVMPFMADGSLGDRIAAGRRLTWTEAADLGVKLAGALETTHAIGVLHRDVKPDNVLFTDWGEPQLTDFGIARVHDSTQTRTGIITASIHYAAPEVLAGRRADAVSDVYSLAATLHNALTGEPAFARPDDESLIPILARIASEPPPELAAHGVPRELADVVLRGMAKRPAERYQSAAAFGEALQEVQRALGVAVSAMALPRARAAVEDADVTVAFDAGSGPEVTVTPPAVAAPERAPDVRAGLNPAPGLAAVALLLVTRALVRSVPDLGSDPTAEAAAAVLREHRPQTVLAWFTATVALVLIVWFFRGVCAVVVSAMGRRSPWAWLAVAGAGLFVVLQVVAQVFYAVLILESGGVQGMLDSLASAALADYTAYLPLALFVAAVSVAALRHDLLPRWLASVGMVLAPVTLLAFVLALFGVLAFEEGPDPLIVGLVAWLGACSVTLRRPDGQLTSRDSQSRPNRAA